MTTIELLTILSAIATLLAAAVTTLVELAKVRRQAALEQQRADQQGVAPPPLQTFASQARSLPRSRILLGAGAGLVAGLLAGLVLQTIVRTGPPVAARADLEVRQFHLAFKQPVTISQPPDMNKPFDVPPRPYARGTTRSRGGPDEPELWVFVCQRVGMGVAPLNCRLARLRPSAAGFWGGWVQIGADGDDNCVFEVLFAMAAGRDDSTLRAYLANAMPYGLWDSLQLQLLDPIWFAVRRQPSPAGTNRCSG